ncbi:hypothetical protein ACIQPQ_02280 [Streptomyces sp. NPDC091281]|uniref:hypothetical protein n=1 Tax=Streptomyces sp. NPDC091281 TaxID=3365985 RepID=UPI0038256061
MNVTVRPVDSNYPEAKVVARETEELLKVYVQRLRSGDADDLARLGVPWFTGKEGAARRLIAAHGAQAGMPVKAVVADPVAPGLASVDLRFADGSRQTLDLTRADGVWWAAMGEGDPMNP